jgi:hypothetical protein
MKFTGTQLPSTDFEGEVDHSTVLNLANRRLKKVENVTAPLTLKVLNLAGNNLVSLDDIQLWYARLTSPHLEYLHVPGNKLESLQGLDAFGHLRYLDAKRNAIASLGNLDEMKQLRYVDISENRLASLSAFALFPALETLVANRNVVKSISGLQSLTRLEYLDLRQNCVQHLDGAATRLAPNIKTLYLDGNPLVDPVNLLFLRPFFAIEKLSLLETPLAKKLVKQK